MAALPTRTDLSGTPSKATAQAALVSVFDFVAQRMAAGTTGAGAATAAEVQTSRESFGIGSLGVRNLFINGAMKIDQRNAGGVKTFTAAAALAYCVDGWYGYCNGANVTAARVAVGSLNRYRFTGLAGVTGVGFGQRIEAASSMHLAGLNATLQVKLSSSSLTSVGWAAYYANTADTFGALASPTRTSIASGSFTINATESAYSATIAIPGAATTGLEIVLTGGALLGGQTLTIGDAQLEQGSFAAIPPFENRPKALELLLCQTRVEKSFSLEVAAAQNSGGSSHYASVQVVAASTLQHGGFVPFMVKKRATPTITYYNPSNVNAQARNSGGALDTASLSSYGNGEHGFSTTYLTNASSVVGSNNQFHWMAEAELP